LNTVTFTATDDSGNTDVCTVDVTVDDTEDPVISCPANITVCDGDLVVPGTASATDNCDSNPTITSNDPGVYPVGVTSIVYTAKDVAGNESTCTQIITVNANPSEPQATFDCGPGFGNATVTIVSPLGNQYQYSVDGRPFQSNPTFMGFANGLYSVVVFDSSTNCSETGSINVSCGCDNAPGISFASTASSVCGIEVLMLSGNTFENASQVTLGHNGSGTLNQTVFTNSPFSFGYTPGPTDGVVIITAITDDPDGSGPCAAATATFTLTVNDLPDANVASTDVTCFTANDGTAIATGGIGYEWNTGALTAEIAGLSPGTYTCTVTNAVGCTTVVTTEIQEGPAPTVPQFSLQSEYCSGATPGALPTTSSNGVIGNWTPSVVSTTISGTYVFTPTTYCAEAYTHTVIVNENPNGQVQGPNQFCPGSSIVLSYSASNLSYVWNTGSIAQSITVNVAGTYTVTVTDTNGCTSVDSVSVTESATIVPTYFGNEMFCDGDSTVLTTSGFDSQQWRDDGENILSTTDTLVVTEPGMYILAVTSGGCGGSVEILTTERPEIESSLLITDAACYGENGSLQATVVDADANDTFLYVIEDQDSFVMTVPADTLDVSLPPGSYWVTVVDSFPCMNTFPFVITQPDSIDIFYDGTEVTFEGGVGEITYTVDSLSATSIEVNAVDENGCEASEIFATTSTADQELRDHITLSPNPVSDILKVDYGALDIKIKKVQVINAFGKVLLTVEKKLETIDIRSLQPNNYYLRIYSEHTTVTKKFIVIR